MGARSPPVGWRFDLFSMIFCDMDASPTIQQVCPPENRHLKAVATGPLRLWVGPGYVFIDFTYIFGAKTDPKMKPKARHSWNLPFSAFVQQSPVEASSYSTRWARFHKVFGDLSVLIPSCSKSSKFLVSCPPQGAEK